MPELDPAARGSGGLDHGAAEGRRRGSREHRPARATAGAHVSDLRTISEIAPLVQSGTLSPVDLVAGCLEAAAHAIQPERVHHADGATRRMADAERAEAEIASGHYRGPLHGIPIAVKDLIDVAGTQTTSGSALPADRGGGRRAGRSRDCARPARSSSARPTCTSSRSARPATRRRSARCAIRWTSRARPADRAAGRRSALATGMAFGALGTDTGGSIRIPSAVCGIVGLKPALGEVSIARGRAAERHAGSRRARWRDRSRTSTLMHDVLTGDCELARRRHTGR